CMLASVPLTDSPSPYVYTLSLHDALPIFGSLHDPGFDVATIPVACFTPVDRHHRGFYRLVVYHSPVARGGHRLISHHRDTGLAGSGDCYSGGFPTVITGGMRSVTVAQAVQYWFKLSALLIPTIFIVLRLGVGDADFIPDLGNAFDVDLVNDSESSTYRTISLVAALILGTLGLSHVLVRFYTNPDGGSA